MMADQVGGFLKGALSMPDNPLNNLEKMYETFRDVSRLVHSSTSLKEVLDRVVWKGAELLGAKGALLRMFNEDTQEFEVAAAFGMGEHYLNKGGVSRDRVLSNEIRRNKVLVIDDIWSAPRVEYPNRAWDEGVRMMLDVPLTMDEKVLGVIRIYLEEKREFSERETDFLVSLAEQCACAINKTRMLENQKAQYNHLAIHTEKMSALGRMAAGIAHEINNPLAGILLYSSNLSKKVSPEGPVKEGLDVIIRETVRCKGIIQELLEFSREKPPKKEVADLNLVLEKALNMLENEFRLHHIQIESQLERRLPQTLLDENQIEQVFVNLLLNAVQAIDQKGKITVKSRPSSDRKGIVVSIGDTGCGIPEKNLTKIFDPFFSTKAKGTGLGLAVSYGIVNNHNGTIKASSRPGEGSVFELRFPVTLPQTDAKEPLEENAEKPHPDYR
jgi:signal transduction histidine kinase